VRLKIGERGHEERGEGEILIERKEEESTVLDED